MADFHLKQFEGSNYVWMTNTVKSRAWDTNRTFWGSNRFLQSCWQKEALQKKKESFIEMANKWLKWRKMAQKWPKWQKILQFKAKSTYISHGRFSFEAIWGQLLGWNWKDQHSQGHGTQIGPSKAQTDSCNLVEKKKHCKKKSHL